MRPPNPNRREFLQAGAVTAAALAFPSSLSARKETRPEVMTVAGPVAADELGVALPHEHVLVDFVGAEEVSPERYDREEAFKIILPHLQRVRELGCRALFECTPAYLGRDPRLLLRLTEASGVRLVTNTGYYGARQGKFLPQHALEDDADALAARWLAEWREGIEGTEVRPGFIKIGVDAGPLAEANRKLVQAAARAHLGSGLTIAGHTGDGRAALEQLAVLRREGVAGSAWIWVHAQNEREAALHRQVAEQGAWVSFDGVAESSLERHVAMVVALRRAELLHRVLVSHDAGWYSVGEPRGGTFRGYTELFTGFLPALRKAGLSAAEIELLTVTNPARAYTLGVRRA